MAKMECKSILSTRFNGLDRLPSGRVTGSLEIYLDICQLLLAIDRQNGSAWLTIENRF
jgi:hypothetical protein